MLISVHRTNLLKYRIRMWFKKLIPKRKKRVNMDYLSQEHAQKLLSELRLIELSIGTAQQRYAYLVQRTAGPQDRGALEAAISNLKTRRFELEIQLLTIQEHNS